DVGYDLPGQQFYKPSLSTIRDGILQLQLPGDGLNVGARRIHRNSVSQPSDSSQAVPAPGAPFDWARGGPEYGLAEWGELKTCRKDANDGVRHAAQRDGLSHYILPRTKSVLPRGVAQHHGLRRGGLVFSNMEVASQKR